VTGNTNVTVLACTHGGHCGFVGPASGDDDGYWAEQQIVTFVEQHAKSTSIETTQHLTAVTVSLVQRQHP
jgi:predicted alpha/beta-fold hydrolase